jgi:hypothetical protein
MFSPAETVKPKLRAFIVFTTSPVTRGNGCSIEGERLCTKTGETTATLTLEAAPKAN